MHNVYVFTAGFGAGAALAILFARRLIAKAKAELAQVEEELATLVLKVKNKL